MCIKITVPVRMVRGLVPLVAVIHGCWTMSRTQRVRGTAIGNIAAIVVRQRQKPFIPAATATVTVRGKNIPPPSIGVKVTAATAAIRTTNMPATA